MKTYILCYALLLLCSCNKAIDAFQKNTPPSEFTKYTIKKGQHSADQSSFNTVEISELRFMVKFDSSAIYQTAISENQYDINKLYGFSDNNMDHHQYSARFGWGWTDNALHLYAYVYNGGKRTAKELGSIAIGTEIMCRIQVTPTTYIFTWGDKSETMPRTSTTPTAKGYMLYPYFGGDEVAPHDVNIWIKNL